MDRRGTVSSTGKRDEIILRHDYEKAWKERK
jgi:hypothetical protein